MSEERFKLVVGVLILLIKKDKVFLIKRKNTGWEDGKYSLFGGHINGDEKVSDAAIRETQEEIGIKINPKDLRFVNVTHLITSTERIHFAFVANKWTGEPINQEPEKADDGAWFPINNLPKSINEVSREIIGCYQNSIPFEETGWK